MAGAVREQKEEIPGAPKRGFNPKFIEALKPAAKMYELADPITPGLRLRVHRSGVKSFRWVVNSVGRVVTLGPWSMNPSPGHVTLAEAREWLERLKMAHEAGMPHLEAVIAELNVRAAGRARAAAPAGVVTVASLAEDWLQNALPDRRAPHEVQAVRRSVMKDIVPRIGMMPIRALKRSQCKDVVLAVKGRGKKAMAGKVLDQLKQMLDYAETTEDEFINPAARLTRKALGLPRKKRKRRLSDAELSLFWRALDSYDGPPETAADRRSIAAAFKIMLLTGVRPGALCNAHWTEVDFQRRTWTIPIENQKTTKEQAERREPYVIPLLPTALALFHELRPLARGSEWVLPGTDVASPRTVDSLNKARQRLLGIRTERKQRKRAPLRRRFTKPRPEPKPRQYTGHPLLIGMEPFIPKDLRRTMRSGLRVLRVPIDIRRRCLNHSLGILDATYEIGDDFITERTEALEKWDAYIQALLAPEKSNVEFLRTDKTG